MNRDQAWKNQAIFKKIKALREFLLGILKLVKLSTQNTRISFIYSYGVKFVQRHSETSEQKVVLSFLQRSPSIFVLH